MRSTLFSTLLLLASLTPASCADSPEKPDLPRIYDHIHKTFSTPLSTKLQISELKPSPIAGMLSGKLEISEGPQKQVMTILISGDGHRYVLSEVFETEQSSVPALRIPVAAKDQAAAPPVLVAGNGRHVVYGPLQDASVDPEKAALSKMDLKGVPADGPADAPVVLVEYSDLQCPYCEKAHALLEKEVFPAYPGKIRWVFKNYPLQGIHPWAYDGALAAVCAARLKPDSYVKFIAAAFREQRNISPANLREKALGLAKDLGLDKEAFASCFDKKESQEAVEAAIREADSLGVTGTPTLFVNGRRLRSYQPAEVRRIIDEMLGTAR